MEAYLGIDPGKTGAVCRAIAARSEARYSGKLAVTFTVNMARGGVIYAYITSEIEHGKVVTR